MNDPIYHCGQCRVPFRGDSDDPYDRLCAACAAPRARTVHRAPPAAPSRAQWGDAVYWHTVYPQPGCDLAVLPDAEQVRAQAILRTWRPGLDRQGCVNPGGGSPLLDVPRLRRLLDAGFRVDLDVKFFDVSPYVDSDARDDVAQAELEAEALAERGFEFGPAVREIRVEDPTPPPSEPPAARPMCERVGPFRVGPFRVETLSAGHVRVHHADGGLVPTSDGRFVPALRFRSAAAARAYAAAVFAALLTGHPRPRPAA